MRSNIFDLIDQERQSQDAQWGGAIHDDSHDLSAWHWFISKQLKLTDTRIPEIFEHRMVKVAALAVAAIESSRRQRKPCSNSE
jgi:hypothetical protein